MRVEDLSDAERRVWEAFPVGEEVDFTTGKPEEDDPAAGAAWDEGRTVRARVIAALLMSEEPPRSHRIPALRIKGARITEWVNLAYSTLRHSARFLSCFFAEKPSLHWARCPQLSFNGSHLPGLYASNAQVDGHLLLEGCVFTGPVELRGAQLAGSLTLSHARSLDIDCDRLQAGRGIAAIGLGTTDQVSFSNVKVSGTVTLDHARLAASGRSALNMDGLIADGSVFCRWMTVTGMVSLRNARVTGPFGFTGTTIDHPGQMVFRGSRITAEGGLYLGAGFTATGTVRLANSRIDRELSLSGAHLTCPGGDALQAAELQVEGSFDADGLSAEGRVDLSQARVSGSLNLTGTSLSAPGGVVLDADGVSVGGGLSCTKGFRAEGAVRLADARIGTFADFNGARLSNPDGQALDLAGASVGAGLECGRGFVAEGELTLIGARIGRHLYLNDATLSAPGGRALAAWQLQARELYLRPKRAPEGTVDLRHAQIGVIRDDPATWSPRRQDGLTYEALDPTLPAARRLAWLRDDPDGYVPQPYEQLAAVYRRLGQDVDARTVLLVKQRRQRAALPRYARVWGWLQDVTVGYGYRPVRAALWFLALLVTGAVVFAVHNPPRAEPGKGPAFNALFYALDLLLPVIDFGQEKAYQPVGAGQWVAYGLVIAGWVLVTTIATGITRTLSRH
ncbi:hypothetical protein ABZU75_18110 [Streptosporangium sp. NPDC005286]|uniref:hypothetical protein n=1 Tax=Streptosporangium sp. NPDC005286 TaxID=3154463 RepID=UPI0033B02FA1